MSFCSDSATMLKSDPGNVWFCNVAMHPIALIGEALVMTVVSVFFFFLSNDMSVCSDSATMLKSHPGNMWFCNVALHVLANAFTCILHHGIFALKPYALLAGCLLIC